VLSYKAYNLNNKPTFLVLFYPDCINVIEALRTMDHQEWCRGSFQPLLHFLVGLVVDPTKVELKEGGACVQRFWSQPELGPNRIVLNATNQAPAPQATQKKMARGADFFR
jgi:hypothetical protein